MARSPFRTFVRVAMALAATATPVAAAYQSQSTAPSTKSVWSGVYTKEQAAAGEILVTNKCAECHGDDLAGIEQAPALAGGTFGENWTGATLKKLFDRIASMPPDKPKSLTDTQYTEILAFLLSVNEIPAGTTALGADRGALAEIVFTRTRPK